MIIHGKAEIYSECDRCGDRIETFYPDLEDIPEQGIHTCNNCIVSESRLKQKDLITNEVKEIMSEKAKRENTGVRYDLLIPEFLEEMARLASHGAEKHGDRNWQASRLTGDKSRLNHLYKHLIEFQLKKNHDFFEDKKGHLVAVAFNAMMEWWYESNGTPE